MEVDLPRVARTFLRFARGELPGPPSDAPVGVYLGGRLVRTIAGDDQQDRSQWEGLCPDPGGYAGRSCPFSVLDPLRAVADGLRIDAGPASMVCAHPTPLLPSDVGGTQVVSLVPDPTASCVDWVAVELFVNDVSQVVAVNLIWAEP